MAWQKIQKVCPRCSGLKSSVDSYNEENEPVTVECSLCKGKGYVLWGRLKVEVEAD